jgi:16S rRNA (cytosine1402-N4)-methyltransferase
VHQPVLLKELAGSLNLKSGDIILDATFGGGGHAREILDMILPDGRLIALDADEAAAHRAADILKDYGSAFTFVNENFRNLDRILAKQNIKHIDAALFDVGVSSYQFDEDSRGFSIRGDGPLDMRIDRRQKVTAHDIVNRLKERELSDIIKEFGEERFHKRIARYIVEARNRGPITTTAELAAIIHKAIGYRSKNSRIDPATRTFQAVRIAVNDELAALEEGIKKAVSWLGPGGRIAVISFHSLEDRIVKNLFRGYAALGVLKVITKKPVRPGPEEIAGNARARSGRLRIAERV